MQNRTLLYCLGEIGVGTLVIKLILPNGIYKSFITFMI